MERLERLLSGDVIESDALDAIKLTLKPQFPDTPEGELFFSIVFQAISDAFMPVKNNKSAGERLDVKLDAIEYLSGDIIHAQMAGVDPDWVYETCLNVFLTYKDAA